MPPLARHLRRFARRQQGQQSTGTDHGEDVVEGRGERSQQIEAGKDDHGQEEGVVVEDGEGGRLVLGDVDLLPQHPLVALLAAHLLIVGELGGHLARDRVLALDGNLVLHRELGVAVRHRQQVRAQAGHNLA